MKINRRQNRFKEITEVVRKLESKKVIWWVRWGNVTLIVKLALAGVSMKQAAICLGCSEPMAQHNIKKALNLLNIMLFEHIKDTPEGVYMEIEKEYS